MSRELDFLAKQYAKRSAIVLRKDILLNQTSIATELSGFTREVERISKQARRHAITIVAVVSD